jgi:DNA-directed RNA polymerase specialized sigma24 family protein
MARKTRSTAEDDTPIAGPDRIACLLALIATKDMDVEDAAIRLSNIGFSAREIAALFDVNLNYVNAAKHRKKASARAKSKKKA